MTLPKVLLWQHLRGRPNGVKFRHQHPIDPYVVDSYCPNARIVIEIDGRINDGAEQIERDATRERFLAENGYHVVRCSGGDVMRDAVGVARSILALAARPLHHPADGPPPRAGEDRASTNCVPPSPAAI